VAFTEQTTDAMHTEVSVLNPDAEVRRIQRRTDRLFKVFIAIALLLILVFLALLRKASA
jgi:hypothetical protein